VTFCHSKVLDLDGAILHELFQRWGPSRTCIALSRMPWTVKEQIDAATSSKNFSYEFDTNSTYSHLLFAARPENKDDLAGRTVMWVTVATNHDHVGRFILAAPAAPAGYMLEK